MCIRDSPSTAAFLGAKVEAILSDGSSLFDWHVSGEGLCSDQEHALIFGLGESKKATKVVLTLAGGKKLSKNVEDTNLVSW